jgi:hypothetical protein
MNGKTMKNGFTIALKITRALIGLCCTAFTVMRYQHPFVKHSSKDWNYLIISVPMIIFYIFFLVILYSVRKNFSAGWKEILQGDY